MASPKDIRIEGSRFIHADSYHEMHMQNGSTYSNQQRALKKLRKRMIVPSLPEARVRAPKLEPSSFGLFEDTVEWFERERGSCGQPVRWLWQENVVDRTLFDALLEYWSSQQQLAGAYLSSPGFSPRHQLDGLPATIAYQLIRSFPGIGHYIGDVFSEPSAVFGLTFLHHFTQLIVHPLVGLLVQRESSYEETDTKVFIIDDLDDHIGAEILQSIVNDLERVLEDRNLPLVFLVLSHRPPRAINRLRKILCCSG